MSAPAPDNTDLFSAPSGGGAPFDISALLQATRRYFWIPLVLAPLAFVAAFIYAKTATPMYRASAEIRLESPMIAAASLSGATTEGTMSPEELNTVIRTFVNPVTAREVVKKLKLTERPYFTGSKEKFPSEDNAVTFLMANTKAAIVTGTRLLQVSVDYRDPNVAMELANAMAEAGMAFDSEQRAAALRQNVKYLEDEVKQLEEKLVDSEKRQNEYMRTQGVSTDQDLNIESDKLKDLNGRAVEANAKRMQLESSYKEIQAYRNDPDALLGIESIRSAPGVASLIAKANDLKGNLAKLSKRYRPGNPFMIQARTELAEVEQSLRQQALDVAKGIEAGLAAARGNEESIAAEKAQQELKVIKVNEESIPSKVLRRQVETDRLAYEAALKKRNEELSQTRNQMLILQMSGPAGPGYMVSMGTGKVVGVATLGGLFAGLALIFLIAQLDKSIKSVETAETVLKLSVLAAVPKYNPPAGKEHMSLLDYPVMQDKYSAAAEAFRTLRIAIDPPDSTEERAFILMVGSSHGDGATFCSLNLAAAMGQSGQRTLLVDANLRKPALEERIFESSGHYGLTDYLVGQVPFSSIIRSTPADNVDVVTAGTPNAHPVEILSRSRFAEFLEEARSVYDRVVFDSAPLTAVSDTLGFAHHCHAICFVVRSGKTSPAVARRALELLNRGGVRTEGIVLNHVSSLFPVKVRKRIQPEEIVPTQEGFEFPVQCPSCHRSYVSADDFVQRTAPPGEEWTDAGGEMSNRNQRIVRKCVCNSLIVLPPVKRRDSSADGVRRRDAFADLLTVLRKSGMARDEARTKLLLTVKMWRNELSDEPRRENSEASQQRRKLFDEVLTHLVLGGLPEPEARERLLHTIKIWQHAP